MNSDALLVIIFLVIFIIIIRRASRKNSESSSTQYKATSQNSATKAKPTLQSAPVKKIVTGRAFVVDGDSLIISKTEIRIFGVDCPEMTHPYGKSAKFAMIGLCKSQEVRAELTGIDLYGRQVAKCFLPDGRDLSAEMVKLGLALDWAKFSGGIYRQFEPAGVRKKLWLADARQRGRMDLWEKFAANQDKSQL